MTQPGWGTDSTLAATPRRRPVADLFDETFRLYRQNFALMVVVFGVFQVPAVVLSLPLWAVQAQWQAESAFGPPRIPSMDQLGPLFGGALVIAIGTGVLGTLASAAIAYVVSRARTGDRPPVRHVFQVLGRHASALLGLVLIGIAAFLAAGLIVSALILAVAGGGGAAIGAFLITAIVGFIGLFVVAARLSLAISALMVERTGALDAFRRSWVLTAGSTLRTFGILMLGGLVVGLIGGLVNPIYLPGIGEGFLAGSVSSYVIVGVGSGLIQVLVGPILPALLTVLYFDYVDREREIAISRTV